MKAITHAINEFFNGDAPPSKRKVGFVLMVFPFGDTTGRCNYMSNGADRRDVVTLMRAAQFQDAIHRFLPPCRIHFIHFIHCRGRATH